MAGNIRKDIDELVYTDKQTRKKRAADAKKVAEDRYKIELNYAKKLKKDISKLTADDYKEIDKLALKHNEKLKKQDKERAAQRKKDLKDEFDLAQGFIQKTTAAAKIAGKAVTSAIQNSLSTAINKGMSTSIKGVEDYIGAYSKYMTGIETRLQGTTDRNFSTITGMISSQVGASPYVRQSAVLENLSRLVESGINYNVEQRAFLATISNKIATTFDAANGTLLHLIRVQQADTTAARLGLEASLTKYFNAMFGDTSYLTNTFDTVSSNLLGATSQLGYQSGVEFEYAVQKWLGSLGSVGVSDTTLSSIASGLSSLATGDITGLSGTTLERLFLMSGLDYGSTLTQGLTTDTANELLYNMINVLQGVARTNNQVVKAQYANLFGVTLTDLTAIMNLTAKDLDTIAGTMLNYQQTLDETVLGLSSISKRMTMQDQIENVFDNILSGVGENIANSALGYTTWLMADLLEKATGGISGIEMAPFGVGISTSVTQLLKTGIIGASLITEIPTIINSLLGEGLSLSNWGATDTTSRGTGFTSVRTTGSTMTTSQASFVGSQSTSDIFEGSVADAGKQAEMVTGEEKSELVIILEERIATDVNFMRHTLDSIESILANNIGRF